MAKSTTPSNARPPIVAVLGHVDHGKTTLLDYIRHTHVQAREAGGITQSIGAYQAEFDHKQITFIDTPGHAAFSAMRSRGASVADLAVLVVAADDGVKPQTKESISHLLSSKTPFIVAINKMDKPGVIPDQAKAELTQEKVFVEGYGGNTPVVELSAKTGKGVDSLLENILLMAELEELESKPNNSLVAPIIEAHKDMKKGVTVSVVVKEGTIQAGDQLMTNTASGKVRALFSANGQLLQQAKPGTPVQILGFKDLPSVGEIVIPQDGEPGQDVASVADPSLANLPAEPVDNTLNIILRSDTLGSLEAIKGSLSDEINYILSGTGDISKSDVLLAVSTNSLVLGFNVKASSSTLRLAESEGVLVKTYPIIYELLEYLEKKILRLLEPTIDEQELGTAKVLKVFEINGNNIAGSLIESGELSSGDTIHLKKKSGVIKDARIKSIRIGKDKVPSVKAGKECGIRLFPNLDITEKDVIISYKKVKTDD